MSAAQQLLNVLPDGVTSLSNIGQVDETLGKLAEAMGSQRTKKLVVGNESFGDLFSAEIILKFKRIFKKSTSSENALSAAEFKDLMLNYIPLKQAELMYQQIDVNGDGFVQFSEFIDYLLASEKSSSCINSFGNTKLVFRYSQSYDRELHHHDNISFLCYSKYGFIFTAGMDGRIIMWNSNNLSKRVEIDYVPKNRINKEVMRQELKKGHTFIPGLASLFKDENSKDKVPIACMCVMSNSQHLIIGTGDRIITVYEFNTRDIIGRIYLKFLPTYVYSYYHEYFDKSQMASVVEPCIVVGDSNGCMHYLKLDQKFGTSNEAGSGKKYKTMFLRCLSDPVRFKSDIPIHDGWITNIMYVSEMDLILTSSADGTVKFISTQHDELSIVRVFDGHKTRETPISSLGINKFDFSVYGKYVASCGDRTLLVWDPYNLEKIYENSSFGSIIVTLKVVDKLEKLVVACQAKTISLFHYLSFELLQVVVDSTHYLTEDIISNMLYIDPDMSSQGKEDIESTKHSFITAGNILSKFTVERASLNVQVDQEVENCSVLYNALFMFIIIVSTNGFVRVYQAQSGLLIQAFSLNDIETCDGDVTYACFDKQQRRLITCRGKKQVIEFWNFNNGENVMKIEPNLHVAKFYYSAESSRHTEGGRNKVSTQEMTEVTHRNVTITMMKYEIYISGIHKRIEKKIVFACGSNGAIYCFIEQNCELNVDPNFLLIRSECLDKDVKVIFLEAFPFDNILAASYDDGELIHWDIEKATKRSRFLVYDFYTGPMIHCMKKKVDKLEKQKNVKAHHHHHHHQQLTKDLTLNGIDEELFSDVAGVDVSSRSSNAGHLIAGSEAVVASAPSSEHRASFENAVLSRRASDAAKFMFQSFSASKSSTSTPSKRLVSSSSSAAAAAPARLASKLTGVAEVGNDGDKRDKAQQQAGFKSEPIHNTALQVVSEHKEGIAGEDGDDNDDINDDEEEKDSFLPHYPSTRSTMVVTHNFRSTKAIRGSLIGNNAAPLVMKISSKFLDKLKMVTNKLSLSSDDAMLAEGGEDDYEGNKPGRLTLIMNPKLQSEIDAKIAKIADLNKREYHPTPPSADKPMPSSSAIAFSGGGGGGHMRKSVMVPIVAPERIGPSKSASPTAPVRTRRVKEPNLRKLHSKVVLNASVYLPNMQVQICACTDRLLRFYDAVSNKILCSSKYVYIDEESEKMGSKKGSAGGGGIRIEEDLVKNLTINDAEDILIASYESGMVRVWHIVQNALDVLRQRANDQSASNKMLSSNSTALLPHPIIMLYEWQAHESPIIYMKYVWFAEDKSNDDVDADSGSSRGTTPGSPSGLDSARGGGGASFAAKTATHLMINGEARVEGFLVTCGLDQDIVLWTIYGKFIGCYGGFGWDINNMHSWIKEEKIDLEKKVERHHHNPQQPLLPKPSAPISFVNQFGKTIVRGNSGYLVHEEKRHNSNTLNTYVENLTNIIRTRPPMFECLDKDIKHLMTSHPIEDVDQLGVGGRGGRRSNCSRGGRKRSSQQRGDRSGGSARQNSSPDR